MFNKESLKKLNKGQYLVTTLVSSVILAAATLVGCGAKADSGGAEVATEALVETDVGEINEEETPDATEDVAEEDPEDILEREKPAIYRKKSKKVPIDAYITSNQFLMIEEVEGEEDYVKVKGTLYEVYLDGKPEYDLVYYPGDVLPDGYTVETTYGYEVVLGDTPAMGEGHDIIFGNAWLIKEDDSNTFSYKEYLGAAIYDHDIDPNIPLNKSYSVCPAVEPGMYGNLYLYELAGDNTLFIQYLTKEDMEKLPEGAELAENVAHQ